MAELFSIEVFIRKLYSLDTPCYLPSISFRLLDFPTQTINITNIERIEKIQNKIASKPQSITDLERLKNSRGEVIFNKGKSCLFPMGFDNAVIQLSSIPLFVVLADAVRNNSVFVGSIGISLNEIMMKLQDCILKSSEICNASVQGSYPIKNLMGSRVGKVNLEVKLCYYGTNLVHHIPILSDVAEAQNSSFAERPKDDFLSSTQHITDILHDDTPKQTVSRSNSTDKKRSDSAEKTSSASIELDSEADSDKEMDTTENNNPPPLYYQAVSPPCARSLQSLQESTKSEKRTQSERSEKPSRTRVRSSESQPISQFKPQPPPERADYDPTQFGLLRAVLTELTYLTDYLDPKLMSNIIESVPNTLESAPDLPPSTPLKHTPSAPKGPEKASEVLAKHLGKEGASTLMDSYLPKERTPVVNRAVLKTNAKPVLVSSQCQTEEMSPRVAWEQSSRSSASPRHKEFPSQQRIDTQPSSNQGSVAGSQHSDSVDPTPALGTTPFSIKERGYESYNRSNGNAEGNHGNRHSNASGNHGNGHGNGHGNADGNHGNGHGNHRNTDQSTGSMNMAQVIAAMQAIARTSSRLSHSGELGEMVYSDNFEDPSCTSLRLASSTSIRPHSQTSRPISRHDNRSTSPVKSRLSNRGGYNRETSKDTVISVSPNNELIKKKSSRNTRYQKKQAVHYDSDSSSTTTTTSSTHYSYVRRRKSSESRRRTHSKSKSLSRQSLSRQSSLGRHSSRSISPIKSSTSILVKRVESADSSSTAMTNKGCQTPVPSRSMSIQTNLENESSDNTTTQQTMIKSPVRVRTPHSPFREQTPRVPSEMTDCHSDHSSLRSGSIYIGDSDEEVSDEDPLKLSYLLSTESVQFSDEDHPTSLLKLCSPSEARVANKFMYTF